MIHTFHTILSTPVRFKTVNRIYNSTNIGLSDHCTSLRNPTSLNFGILHVSAVSGSSKCRNNNPAAVAATAVSAAEVVRKFYGGINRRDLASVESLIAQNCIYEDLVFPQPFRGRKAILEFFNEFVDSISSDLQFVIDDISEENTSAVGVTWHLEWKGKQFPFSKGCSFYRLDVVNGQRQIVYGRDIVEPAVKPGEAALVVIRGVTWLLQKFPFLVDRL